VSVTYLALDHSQVIEVVQAPAALHADASRGVPGDPAVNSTDFPAQQVCGLCGGDRSANPGQAQGLLRGGWLAQTGPPPKENPPSDFGPGQGGGRGRGAAFVLDVLRYFHILAHLALLVKLNRRGAVRLEQGFDLGSVEGQHLKP